MAEQTTRRGSIGGAQTVPSGPAGGHRVQIGARFGRYELRERIGSGGMGVVYAAWDPEVERTVALKLLWPGSDPQRVPMLTREARAMARLSDPRVVQVFDVGVDHGQVWVAMEFIGGCSLDAWLARRSRSWAEVLDVYLEAAHGLEAAHRSGVVHRDFKPSNVMLSCSDPDGSPQRVLVADFGLARAHQDDLSSGRAEATDVSDVDLSESIHPLTQTGFVAGTPAYMAPEQHDDARVDPAADQFAFCVALYEGLYGHRPFEGRSVAALASAKRAQRIAAPPPASVVPQAVFRILKRGLQPAPADRWPSMCELADALGRIRQRRRRLGRWGVVGAGAAFAAASAVGWAQVGTEPCEHGGQLADEVWNGSRASAIEDAFEATNLPYARASWAKIRPDLDEYVGQWVDAHQKACRGVGFGPAPSQAARDVALHCLDRSLTHLDALLALFEAGEPATIEHAVAATSDLPALTRCRERALQDVPSPKPSHVRHVEELRTRLAGVEALEHAGQYRRGRIAAGDLLAEAEGLGYGPLTVEVLLALGRLEDADGDASAAERHLERAVWAASEVGYDRVSAEAAIELVGMVAWHGRHDEALEWVRHAEAALGRMDDPGELRAELLGAEAGVRREIGEHDRARELLERSVTLVEGGRPGPTHAAIQNTLGNVAFAQGRYDEAIAYHHEALELYRDLLGPDHPTVALALNGLGMAYQMRGDYPRARKQHEEALALREEALGLEHPDVAGSLSNLGAVALEQRRLDEARSLYERALAIKEAVYGADHIRLAAALQNLGAVELSQGNLDAALSRFTRSLAILESAYGAKHPEVAAAASNLGVTWSKKGDYAAAAEHYRRALAIENEVLGPDHPTVAVSRQNLGYVLFELGQPQAAVDHHRAALERFLQLLGPAHGNTTQARIGLAKALAATGGTVEAIELLQAARRDFQDERSVLVGDIAFELAKLLERRDQSARALALAEEARGHYGSLGASASDELTEVDRWIARGGNPPRGGH